MARCYLPALLVLSTNFCLAADWPTYLQDNKRVGATTEEIVAPLELQWVYSAPASPEMAFAGPRSAPIEGKEMRHRVAFDRALDVAVVGDRLYFGSSVDHKIYCVDVATGRLHWEFFTDGPVRLSPTVWKGKVYVGSDDGHVYCLDANNGGLNWKLRLGPEDERLLARGRLISRWPVRTGVLVDSGVAYFGAGVFPHETVYLCAADAETGELIWRNDQISQEDAGRNDLSPQGYLLCDEDQLFVPSARSLPVSFDRQTGQQIFKKTHSWRTTAGGVVGGTKAVLADGQMYASGPHHFLAMDQESGAVGFAWIDGRQLALSGKTGFVATGSDVVAMDRLEHAEATQKRQEANLELYQLQRNRRDMPASQYQEKSSVLQEQIDNLSEVGVLWRTATPCDAALIVTADLVFAGGTDQIVALDAQDGTQIWQASVDGLASGIVAAGGHVIVSTDEGKIYAFASRTADPRDAVVEHPQRAIENPYADRQLSAMYESAAKKIVEGTGVTRGFCLVVGSEQGQLAYELAKRTSLTIYGIEADRDKAEEARRRLDAAGLHGHRVTIVHADLSKTPFSNYFANLVVSDSQLLTGKMPGDPVEIARHLKPCGGKVCFLATGDRSDTQALRQQLRALSLGNESETSVMDDYAVLTRGKLPGAGAWTHQYGDVANTSMSRDYRVKGGMGILWYGDPGPAPMINRHEAASAPLSSNGRFFVQGVDSILCYDAYNGVFQWEYRNPGAVRTGVFNNEETSNLAASDDALFVAVEDRCTVIDASTGKVTAVHKVPHSSDSFPRVWGYVGYVDGRLVGTSTIRKDLADSLRRRGHTVSNDTDAIFAIDVESGQRLWTYRGSNIMHMTIAIGDGRVFMIDSSITQEQRDALLREDKAALQKLSEKEAQNKEAELKELDVRLAVAIDLGSGEKRWEKPVDVTNCSRVGIGGGQLTLMYHQQHVVICGANANGHYWRQFLSGQFKERRLVVLDAENGELLWDKDANYRHRPIIVENEIIAEPWSFDLHTGKEKERVNPVTGELTQWQFSRPGHHCGMITATPNTLFFRSGFTGYYDLYSDSGTSHFAGHRTGCWINVIPGNGLVMIPEASAGCVCQFSISATVVMEPRTDRDTWRIYSATGAKTPVKNLALNLGAPGDRRDQFGTIWLAYPRPKTVGRLEYDFKLDTKFRKGGEFSSRNSESVSIQNADTPWLCTSLADGLLSCTVPLVGEEDQPGSYRVKLYFTELDDQQPGDRVFDVRLQGQDVAEGLDVVQEAGGAGRQLVKTFDAVDVVDELQVELVPQSDLPPILSAIEIHRE